MQQTWRGQAQYGAVTSLSTPPETCEFFHRTSSPVTAYVRAVEPVWKRDPP